MARQNQLKVKLNDLEYERLKGRSDELQITMAELTRRILERAFSTRSAKV
jgi:hypothetical protein